jgi:acyl carrier protein
MLGGDLGGEMQQSRRMVSRDEVKERLVSLLKEIAGIPRDRLTDDSTIDKDIQMESVAFAEFQVALEDDYNIEVDPIHVVELNRFGDIIDYVHETICANASG